MKKSQGISKNEYAFVSILIGSELLKDKIQRLKRNNADKNRIKKLEEKLDKLTFMKTFTCYIKSHDENPDYERTVKAKNKAEAAMKIQKSLPSESRAEWSPSELLNFINEDK